ncbi:MAG TPA: ATP-binding protein [Nanoarchaeota archaeon]|nr:ATP-binding protein [Nanoarchaeota archaeon]
MDRTKIQKYLADFQNRKLEVLPRALHINESKKIQTVIGARRVGKTYLLFEKIIELEASGVSRKQIIYVNFEDPLLNELKYDEIKEIIDLHWSLYPEIIKKELFLFIDEPQAINKWELAVRAIYDNYKCKIFITGSSSRLLSKEIATSLRGRSVTIMLLPLSFKEFLTFKAFKADIGRLGSADIARILNYFEEYLKFGGYPEVVLEPDTNEKMRILKDYLDMVVYKDIIERYKLKNSRLINWLIKTTISSASKELSLNGLYNSLKSQGLKVSKNTLYSHFSALEDSLFVFALRKMEKSSKVEGVSVPKVYLNDIGFINLFSLENYGQRMENIAFLHLLMQKNKNPLLDVNYWKSQDGKEVDFIVSEARKAVSAIQVCYSLSENATKEREINALSAAMKYFALKSGIILTKDEEKEIVVEKKTIKIIPLWKWLLS